MGGHPRRAADASDSEIVLLFAVPTLHVLFRDRVNVALLDSVEFRDSHALCRLLLPHDSAGADIRASVESVAESDREAAAALATHTDTQSLSTDTAAALLALPQAADPVTDLRQLQSAAERVLRDEQRCAQHTVALPLPAHRYFTLTGTVNVPALCPVSEVALLGDADAHASLPVRVASAVVAHFVGAGDTRLAGALALHYALLWHLPVHQRALVLRKEVFVPHAAIKPVLCAVLSRAAAMSLGSDERWSAQHVDCFDGRLLEFVMCRLRDRDNTVALLSDTRADVELLWRRALRSCNMPEHTPLPFTLVAPLPLPAPTNTAVPAAAMAAAGAEPPVAVPQRHTPTPIKPTPPPAPAKTTPLPAVAAKTEVAMETAAATAAAAAADEFTWEDTDEWEQRLDDALRSGTYHAFRAIVHGVLKVVACRWPRRCS